jgi:hypothetical protein
LPRSPRRLSYNNQSFGTATTHEVRTHVHPNAAGHVDADDTPADTGIDYLALVEAEHREATRRSINFADLANDNPDPEDGDGPLPDRWPHEPPLPFPTPDDGDDGGAQQEATA